MRLRRRIATGLSGVVGSAALRAWMDTLDYRALMYDPSVDPGSPDYCGRKIFIFWHENILFPINLRGHCNISMLLSKHRDADILARIAKHLGFETVRGSTYRGAQSAIRQMLRRSRDMNLTITPDGPRGPRRQLAQGPIYLSSKLQIPLVLMGFGYNRPWRINSWDRFAIPRPFSRARAVVSPCVQIPAGVGRDDVEYYRLRVERLLNRLTEEAEAWAESGLMKPGEIILRKQIPPRRTLAEAKPEEEFPVEIPWRDAA